jgi:putative Holliday junction resolvase
VDVLDLTAPPRLLGLDIGRKRIGLALYDPASGMVVGLDTLQRRTRDEDLARLARIAVERKVAAYVSGLPYNMDGTEGPQSKFVRDFCARLERVSAMPVYFQDERLTSVEAEGRLKDAGWSLKKLLDEKRKGVVDRMAAVILLEEFVRAHAAPDPCGAGAQARGVGTTEALAPNFVAQALRPAGSTLVSTPPQPTVPKLDATEPDHA